MGIELEGAVNNFKKTADGFSATFTVAAEQLNSTFTKAFGLNECSIVSTDTVSIGVVKQPVSFTKKVSDKLAPAICSCCGGKIGRDNYCEYCGTRYW